MLFKKDTLEKIRAGEITLAFRKWKRSTVKSGGTLQTRAGLLQIAEVKIISEKLITQPDAQAAGYAELNSLLKDLDKRDTGQVYRISFTRLGEDPRIALRSDSDLSEEDLFQLRERMARFDKYSKKGPWTEAALNIIAKNPGVVSTQLAEQIGFERFWLKAQIRKLKALGLTISLGVGYQLSPRGEVLLGYLRNTPEKK